ncbi:MAG TPA: protein kinase [Polyangiaceae bacterium]|jgi:serine/threonine protein kinase|nr:protein kinase [Polyangiaceae bacterium]
MPFADPLGLVGVKLGPYVVREAITEGGVAVIYRGEHESLQSAVAVKVLIPDAVAETVRPTLEQMFLREAQILSQLRSEDILRALDHGRVVCPADGVERPYIVVDFLEGRPLADELEQRGAEIPRRPYSLEEAVTLLEPIARALSVCHASGIVHRDVNPRNVFLEDVGDGRVRAKLIDFGFAKEVYRTEALRLESVDGTLFARSPDYAAPEHYDREQYGELSETTDIYTVALMLVEMLTLERPLKGVTDTDLWNATRDENDRPTPNNRGARVSARVEALFAEALAVDQLKRPQVLSEWWERLVTATRPDLLGRGAPGAPEAVADSGEEHTSRRRLERLEKPRTGRYVALALFLVAAIAGAVYMRIRPLQCPAGFVDCNGEHADGCETAIGKDPANCGACGRACASIAGVGCVAGQCAVTTCASGFADCNASVSDGCETDTRTDAANCGKCASVCGSEGTKSASCLAGKCELACKPAVADCNENAADGCETAVLKDPKNCGKCGTTCNDGCVEGLCAPEVLVSGVTATHLAVRDGTVYYSDAAAHRIESVKAGEKPTLVADAVTDVSGLTALGDRVMWTVPSAVYSLTTGAPERLASLTGATPLVVSPQSGYVAWSLRAPPAPPGKHEAKHASVPADRRRVVAAAVSEHGKPATSVAECNEWPRTFAADDHDVYCCDATTPLAAVVCDGAKCTHHDLGVTCPDELAMVGTTVYFAVDVRVFALDRKSNALTLLAKRKHHPRDVVVGGTSVYWAEGEDIYRLGLDAVPAGTPELVARRQSGIAALIADDGAVYWAAAGPGGAGGAVYALRREK